MMIVRFVCAGKPYPSTVRRAPRYLVIAVVLLLAPMSLAALPFGASIETGWVLMQTKYHIDSAPAYGENRPLIALGVRGDIGGISARIDAVFTPSNPAAFVYGPDGAIDSFESRLSSDVILSERLSYLRFSLAAGHTFKITGIRGVTIQPALELFGLRNIAYRSGSTNLIKTWPDETQDAVRKALDGAYVGLSGTAAYRINSTISAGVRVATARSIVAKLFPGSIIRPPEGAEPRRNAWVEIGASVTYTLRPSE